MLEVRGVTKQFGSVRALDAVSLDVQRGEIVGFLGPNGAGKTTLMRAVMGLITIDAGVATCDGVAIDSRIRRRFGYMPAERGMYPKMKVRDQIVYFARLAGLGQAAAGAAADRWMERLGIATRAHDDVQTLSTGNQQRVQLAVSLVHEPDLLLLDEPFSGLDPAAVETMKQVLRDEVARGAAVLFSSHQLDLVSDVSERVVVVNRGAVVLAGEVQQLRENSSVREVRVVFAAPTEWLLADTVCTRSADGRTVTAQVHRDASPADVLAAAERAGTVREFSFTPPDLSDVFLAAVGASGAATTTSSEGADRA